MPQLYPQNWLLFFLVVVSTLLITSIKIFFFISPHDKPSHSMSAQTDMFWIW